MGRLFHGVTTEKVDIEIIPTETNLEFLLVNSCAINVIKVQTIVENFIRDKKHISIFCLTETKVDSHDFEPRGIRMFSSHRGKKDKKGGGLAIGFDKEANIKLEKMMIKNKDILALEGTIMDTKFRIILCYFDSTKLMKGKDYERKRKLQKEMEKLLEVEADTSPIVLGDFNGRLTKLEPTIATDANGKMLEKWTEKLDVYHLNTFDSCNGTYTFQSLNGKSAIDHVLTNKTLLNKHISMHIDEEKTMLNISDHNLVRVWFQLGNNNIRPNWKKKTLKEITWISRDEDRLTQCATSFKSKIGKKISFKKCIEKIKTSVNSTMKKRKKIRPGGKKEMKLLAAEWVDRELIENVKLRSKLNRECRYTK